MGTEEEGIDEAHLAPSGETAHFMSHDSEKVDGKVPATRVCTRVAPETPCK